MKQTADPVISSFKVQSKSKKLIHMLLPKLAIGIALIAAVVVVLVVINIHRNNEPRTGICSKKLILSAYISMNASNPNSLANSVKTIKGLKDYQQDPNCMYITTVYYVKQANVSEAQTSLKQFNKVYNNDLSSLLAKYWSVAELRTNVAFSQKDAQAISNNSAAFTLRPNFSSSKKK